MGEQAECKEGCAMCPASAAPQEHPAT